MSEFAIRVIASILGLAFLFIILFLNGILINIAVFFLICGGLYEINNAFKKLDISLNYGFYILIGILNFIELYFLKSIVLTIYCILFVSLINLLFLRKNIINTSAMTFSLLYVVLGFSSLVLIDNPIFIGLIFVIAFSSDSFAYLVGITFGKHKLIPDVSPKKSVEGAVGGILGSIVLVIIYLNYFNISVIYFDILIAFIGSLVAQCGDLVASRIKRDTGIKDFGKLIPGHGGVLDRFDSVILVAPIVYVLYSFLYL